MYDAGPWWARDAPGRRRRCCSRARAIGCCSWNRATFPSDMHVDALHPSAGRRASGAMGPAGSGLQATNCPPIERIRLDAGPLALEGAPVREHGNRDMSAARGARQNPLTRPRGPALRCATGPWSTL